MLVGFGNECYFGWPSLFPSFFFLSFVVSFARQWSSLVLNTIWPDCNGNDGNNNDNNAPSPVTKRHRIAINEINIWTWVSVPQATDQPDNYELLLKRLLWSRETNSLRSAVPICKHNDVVGTASAAVAAVDCVAIGKHSTFLAKLLFATRSFLFFFVFLTVAVSLRLIFISFCLLRCCCCCSLHTVLDWIVFCRYRSTSHCCCRWLLWKLQINNNKHYIIIR